MSGPETLEGFPLSPLQRRLWASHQAEPRLARCAVRLDGELDPERLEQALDRLVAEHEILRTSFRTLPGMSLPLQVIDSGGLWLERAEAGTEVAAELRETANRLSMHLEEMPRLRALLLVEGPRRWRLELVLPALCADRATFDLLIGELGRWYEALTAGQERTPEPIQFVDLATWQNELLESEEAEAARASLYRPEAWRERHIRLPFARSGPRSSDAGAGRLGGTASHLGDRLAEVSRELGATPYVVLLAVWQVTLGRLSGRRRIVVGAEHDGRKYEELAGALGPFAKLLPVCIELAGDRFDAVVARTADAWQTISEWEEYFDLGELAAIGDDRDDRNDHGDRSSTGDTAGFPICFTYDELPPEFPFGPLSCEILERDAGHELCELALLVERRGSGLRLRIHFDSAVYARADAATLMGRYLAVLGGVLKRPRSPIAELPLLSRAERFQHLVEWNDSRLEASLGGVIPLLVSAWAARAPHHPAVLFEDRILTYRELEELSNRRAHHLRSSGVSRGDIAAVCLERSLEMVVTLLAVLKAGAAYLPLAPDEPRERQLLLMEEAGTPWLVTEGSSAERIGYRPERLIEIELDRSEIAHGDTQPPSDGPGPDDLAYVIYTSGSTGRPKGVMISHGAICNRLSWMQHAFPLHAADRVLQKTPFSFDASIWELFCPLLAGATVVVARPGGHQDPEYLVQVMKAHEVTVLQLVPSALRLLLENRHLGRLTSLRRLYCGGEALPTALVERFREILPIEVVNLYGPTEVSIDASYWRYRPGLLQAIVPIGRALANLRIHLLDDDERLCPPGVAGELQVGGVNLARGYLRQPGQTAERFVPDAFSDTPGERLYRTGDMARFRPDGVIEFLGRGDNQVKIRGFRIELGEIENTLEALPRVLEAAVVTFEKTPGDIRLKACVATPESAFMADEIAEEVRRRLPEHMVPSVFLRLDELPRLSSGKIDRAQLVGLDPEIRDHQVSAAPRSLLRDLIAEMWCEILDLESIDFHADVFERGAHSLLVTRIVLQIQDVFGIKLPLRDIFDAPTVAQLATRVENAMQLGSSAVLEPIERAPRDRPLPLSFAQQRLWFLDQLDPGSTAYCTPEAFRVRGKLRPQLLARAWFELIRRHETLRTVFPSVGGETVQEIRTPQPIAIPCVDLRSVPAEHREAEILRLGAPGRQTPFDLARGPLLRVLLLRLDAAEHVLIVTLHHIVSDAWSGRLVGRELVAFYEAAATGREANLAPLEVQYADFAVWQRCQLRGENLEALLGYWRCQLAGVPFVLDLPTDKPRPAVLSSRGGVRQRSLPAALTTELKAVARGRSSSLYMVLMATYQVLLHQLTGARDLLVGTTVANRDHPATEKLIGFFVNLLALRCRLDGIVTFDELVRQVRDTALEAYAHQALPIDRLIQDLGVERDPSRSTLCQAVFTMDNVSGRTVEAELAGLTLSPVPIYEDTSLFDLALIVEESSDELRVSFRYMSDLYRPETVDGLLESLEWVFRQVAEHPEIGISDLVAGLGELDRQRAANREQALVETSVGKLHARIRSRRASKAREPFF